MSQDRKLEKLWEFRRRDNEFDSSSDDSKSSSSHEPVLKKHKLVSNLILPQHDETSDTLQLDPGMGVRFESGKTNKRQIGSKQNGNGARNKRNWSSTKEGNKKKRKGSSSIHEPISIDDFKIFMESLLDELKVARENMFAEMREKMDKFVESESKPRQSRKRSSGKQKTRKVQHQTVNEPNIKPRNCNGGSLVKSVKTNTNTDSINCEKVHEEQNNHDQEIEIVSSKGKDRGERLKFPADKPINSSNHSDQVVSSPYLTLPTGLSEPRVEMPKINFASSNYIQPGVLAGNNTGKNAARANLVIDASTRGGYFTGIQPEEHFGSFGQMGSKDMGSFNKHNTPTSSMGIGFPIPLHQRLDNSFNMSSQVVQENSSCDNNILGLRMNGGAMGFSGGSYILSEHVIANNFCNRMNYKSDGQLMPFGSQEFKEGRFHPN